MYHGMKKTNGSKKLKGKQKSLPAALKKRSWQVKRKSKELIMLQNLIDKWNRLNYKGKIFVSGVAIVIVIAIVQAV